MEEAEEAMWSSFGVGVGLYGELAVGDIHHDDVPHMETYGDIHLEQQKRPTKETYIHQKRPTQDGCLTWRHPLLMRYKHNKLQIQNTCDMCDFICMRFYILMF